MIKMNLPGFCINKPKKKTFMHLPRRGQERAASWPAVSHHPETRAAVGTACQTSGQQGLISFLNPAADVKVILDCWLQRSAQYLKVKGVNVDAASVRCAAVPVISPRSLGTCTVLVLVVAQHRSLVEPSPEFVLQKLQNGHAEVMELSRPFQAGKFRKHTR